MSSRTIIYMPRHVRVDANAQGLMTGQKEHPTLTAPDEVGEWQGKQLAARLQSKDISKIFTSPSPRAVYTAKEIAEYHPSAEIIELDELKERYYGVDELTPCNKPESEMHRDEWEPLSEFMDRTVRAIEKIYQRSKGETVAVSTHGGLIKMALRYFQGLPFADPTHHFKVKENTALTKLIYGGPEDKVIEYYNSIDHLTSPLITVPGFPQPLVYQQGSVSTA